MYAQEIQEMGSWQKCESLSQHPRYAVAEWLGSNKNLHKTEEANPTAAVKLARRYGRPDLIQDLPNTKKRFSHECDLTALWKNTQSRMDLCSRKRANSLTDYSDLNAQDHTSKVVIDFNERAERWRRDTSFQSSLIAKFMHDDYQTIMAMGEVAIPLILSRLNKAPEHWFWALKHLAKGYDAAEGIDTPAEAAKAWLRWGQEEGYLF